MTFTADIDCAGDAGSLPHFWRSTGFTPATLLFDPALLETLDHLAALPRNRQGEPAIRFVRIHHLLDLVEAKNLGTGAPLYDWSRLDAALDELVKRGMCPFFEVMGNPAGWFSDFRDPAQAQAWRRLCRDLVLHLGGRYGADEVATWPFECWNEPDTVWWKQGIEALTWYFDATEAGVHEADARIRCGGPGTAFFLNDTFKAFIAHCDRGPNRLTGAAGTRLDFISVHEKGSLWSKEDISPNLGLLVQRTRQLMAWVREHHPGFADLPWMNDECDPQIGWADPHTWHARPYYAAWATRQIDWHLTRFRDAGVPFELLGNDHGFVGGWGQRTLLACWGDANDRAKGRYELVKKPICNAHLLWTLLGDRRLPIRQDARDDLAAIATRRGDAVVVLLWHNIDNQRRSGSTRVRLRLAGLGAGPLRLSQHRIDEGHGDPIEAWERLEYRCETPEALAERNRNGWNAEKELPPATYAALRDEAEVQRVEEPRDLVPSAGVCELEFDLPLHGLRLLVLAPRPASAPAAPALPEVRSQPGRTPQEHRFLRWRWSGDAALLRGFAVEFRAGDAAPWVRVNRPDLLAAAWLHVREPLPGGGEYRIRAIDLWGRSSEPSPAIRA